MSGLQFELPHETRLAVATQAIRLLALLPDAPSLENTQMLRRAHMPESSTCLKADRVPKMRDLMVIHK